ncbi:hypothetical protein DAERI_150114 [Deinococcus aerius]|uniref:Uncharacterized protein n=1 Tax=Deinococcus aerius TaxID=200253 RepID=A0A2I9D9M8_9DEIO|nr:hypothetical protein [Deinococcus aerius]GBF07596.1 hypothetical protein DAERI_150114 [Deinococcus aerius]
MGCGCLGCGGGTLLVLALLGALAWFFVIQPARAFLDSWRGPAQTQTQTGNGANIPSPNLPGNGGTTSPAPTGTVDRPVTPADVQRFVRVRREVRNAFGGSLTGLERVWADIQNGQSPNLLTVLNVLREAGGSIGRARQAQTVALAGQGLSPERYAVIRSTVNRALGVPNIDFTRAAEALQQGRLPDLNTAVQTATPEERALVEPFRAELTQTAALGLLGL